MGVGSIMNKKFNKINKIRLLRAIVGVPIIIFGSVFVYIGLLITMGYEEANRFKNIMI